MVVVGGYGWVLMTIAGPDCSWMRNRVQLTTQKIFLLSYLLSPPYQRISSPDLESRLASSRETCIELKQFWRDFTTAEANTNHLLQPKDRQHKPAPMDELSTGSESDYSSS